MFLLYSLNQAKQPTVGSERKWPAKFKCTLLIEDEAEYTKLVQK